MEEMENYAEDKTNYDLDNYKNDNELLKLLSIAIEKMNDYEKELIRLRLNDYTYKEIGEILNKNENAVKTGHSRALNKLKNLCNNLYCEKNCNNEVING